ncbi:MAG: hypothetical protein AB2L16_10250 [Anaerolineaceae bacterium]
MPLWTRTYITYCTLPAENTSAGAAFLMLQEGFTKANPILGGLEARVNAGYPTEP